MTQSTPAPKSGLDVRRPLYDSNGHLHSVMFWSGVQLLTGSRGFVFVWDLSDGSCMIKGLTSLRLSNDRPRRLLEAEPVGEIERRTWADSTDVLDRIRASAAATVAALRGGAVGG